MANSAGPEVKMAPDQKQEHPSDGVPLWLALTVIVLLLAVLFVGASVAREYVDNTGARGYNEAELAAARFAYEADPANDDAALEYGFALQRAALYEAAIDIYDEVLSRRESDTAALYNKGVCLMALGRPESAEAALEAVLEIAPAHMQAAKALGEHYASSGRYQSLLEVIEPAAEENPSMADLQYLLGYARENLGDPSAAADAYRAALRYDPNLSGAHDGLQRLGLEP